MLRVAVMVRVSEKKVKEVAEERNSSIRGTKIAIAQAVRDAAAEHLRGLDFNVFPDGTIRPMIVVNPPDSDVRVERRAT